MLKAFVVVIVSHRKIFVHLPKSHKNYIMTLCKLLKSRPMHKQFDVPTFSNEEMDMNCPNIAKPKCHPRLSFINKVLFESSSRYLE